ncbi:MAG: hypothetical protein OXD45_05725 [Rhodobacteraceae bacterium]|nr:hypothetical protein [Paracoccaceae bacterium]
MQHKRSKTTVLPTMSTNPEEAKSPLYIRWGVLPLKPDLGPAYVFSILIACGGG